MKQQILTSLTTDELRKLIDESVTNALQAAAIGNNTSDDKEIMDLKEVAAFLKVSKHTIYRLTHRREIPHYKKGGKLYFKREEIEAYRDSGKQLTHEEFEAQARKKLRKT
jgi:excisionase family DNA binding protein